MERKRRPKWFLRIIKPFVLLACCICVLISLVPSASAAGIWEENSSDPKFRSVISGSGVIKLRNGMGPPEQAYGYRMEVEFPQIFPQMPVNGDLYVLDLDVAYHDYPIMSGGDESSIAMTIKANKDGSYIDKDDYTFTRVTIDYDIRDNQSINPQTIGVEWYLDPFSFAWDSDFLHNLIRIRSFKKSDIILTGTIWYINDSNKLASYDFNFPLIGVGNNNSVYWVQSVFTQNFCKHFVTKCGLVNGDPVLFTDLKVDVVVQQPDPDNTIVSIGATGLQVLTEGYVSGSPRYARDPVNWFNDSVYKYLYFNPTPDATPPSSNAGNVFTQFLAGAVGGFFDAEIFPGFSLGGVFSVIITIILILLLLKYFAGG